MSEDFSAWIGKQEIAHDRIDAARCNALRAALGQDASGTEGDAMPLLHHWLHFWDVRSPDKLGTDGHPARGDFLPPVPLPRRMWAGGRLAFHQPLKLGEQAEKTSTILDVKEKTGRSGTLVFVTVEHRLSGENGLAIVEEQDLVYREAATSGPALPEDDGTAPQAAWLESVKPDTVLLFRYSALTMNGHRIHYDRSYAMEQEAYPALVVHGPLQATLLAELAQRKLGRDPEQFSYRGLSPAFDGITLHVCGEQDDDGVKLWTQQRATTNMSATAR